MRFLDDLPTEIFMIERPDHKWTRVITANSGWYSSVSAAVQHGMPNLQTDTRQRRLMRGTITWEEVPIPGEV